MILDVLQELAEPERSRLASMKAVCLATNDCSLEDQEMAAPLSRKAYPLLVGFSFQVRIG